MHESNNRNINITTATAGSADAIVDPLNKLVINSYISEAALIAASGNPATSKVEANTKFGVLNFDFDKIITALGGETSNWKFVSIDYDVNEKKLDLTYKNKNDNIEKYILLITNTTEKDTNQILNELSQLNLISTLSVADSKNLNLQVDPGTDGSVPELGLSAGEVKKVMDILDGYATFVSFFYYQDKAGKLGVSFIYEGFGTASGYVINISFGN